MTLQVVGRIPLPSHHGDGGFDHAAVDTLTDRLYVAHPANDAVEVVDLRHRVHLRSLPGLRGVAGVWVDTSRRLLFTSNRGEDTASVWRIEDGRETELWRVPTGVRPNGMAFDPARQLWLIAGVGNPAVSGAPPSLTFVDASRGTKVGTIPAPGRTRWATYLPAFDAFYVNIADPSVIVSVAAADTTRIARAYPIPARGPHGLESAQDGRSLFCACDDFTLIVLDVESGKTRAAGILAGSPDVLWLDRRSGQLYAATDERPTVEVFRTDPLEHQGHFATSAGAHTLTVDPRRHEVHVFLPDSHEDLILGPTAG